MNRMPKIGCLVAVACALALAQQPSGGMKRGMRMPNYDVSSETTVKGTVQDVLYKQMGRMNGTHLLVKTETETIEVYVGPSNFVTSQGFTFAKDDSVQVL